MSSIAVLDGKRVSRGLRIAGLTALAVLLIALAGVVVLNLTRAKARWLTLPDSCPTLTGTVAAQLRVEPAPVAARKSVPHTCVWTGAAMVQTVITRYDGTLLTDPADAAKDAVADVRLKTFRPIGPQSSDTTFGTAGVDFGGDGTGGDGAGHNAVLVVAVANARVVVDYVDWDQPLGEPQREPMRQVVDTLISQLG